MPGVDVGGYIDRISHAPLHGASSIHAGRPPQTTGHSRIMELFHAVTAPFVRNSVDFFPYVVNGLPALPLP